MQVHTTEDLIPLLRREVGRLRARESRRVFDTAVHVGQLGGEPEAFVVRAGDLPAFDVSLRIDLVSALVAGTDPAWESLTVWLTRAGSPDPHDLDHAWLAAARVACGQHGRGLQGFYAITRGGWVDLGTGQRQTWKRLRIQPPRTLAPTAGPSRDLQA